MHEVPGLRLGLDDVNVLASIGSERISINKFLETLGAEDDIPKLPDWVETWRQGEDMRDWPPN